MYAYTLCPGFSRHKRCSTTIIHKPLLSASTTDLAPLPFSGFTVTFTFTNPRLVPSTMKMAMSRRASHWAIIHRVTRTFSEYYSLGYCECESEQPRLRISPLPRGALFILEMNDGHGVVKRRSLRLDYRRVQHPLTQPRKTPITAHLLRALG